MLPDVDQESWQGFQADEFSAETDRKINSLEFSTAADQRIADLGRIGSWATPQPAQPQPQMPEVPPPTPEPTPSDSLPSAISSAPPQEGASYVPGTPPLPTASSVAARSQAAPSSPAVAAPSNLVTQALEAADQAGVDPGLYAQVVQQESSWNPRAQSPAGAQGLSQLMPDTARGLGVTDPFDVGQNLRAGAQYLKQQIDHFGGDVVKALAAYNAGAGNVEKYGGVPPFPETQRYVDTIMSALVQNQGGVGNVEPTQGSALVPEAGQPARPSKDISQFGDPQLTAEEAYAACGPAAAVRFAERFGRNPTLKEALDLAKQVGWTVQQGMAGLGSEQALMDKIGIPTKLVQGPQWDVFAREAQTGNPVTISTAGHYFTADGYDPNTGAFHVGRSGLDLRGGSEWMTPAQMQRLMGDVQGGLLADNPQVPAPSTAQQDTNPSGWLDRAKEAIGSSIGNAVSAVGSLFNGPGVSTLAAGQGAQARGMTEAGQLEGDATASAAQNLVPPGMRNVTAEGAQETGRALTQPGAALEDVTQAYQSPLRQQYLPNITEPNHPINVLADIQAKKDRGEPITDEDRQRYRDAVIAVAGMASPLGGENALFDEFGVERGFVPPNPKAPLEAPSTASKALDRAGAQPIEQPADVAVRGLINVAKARGLDTSDLEAQLREPPITAEALTTDAPYPSTRFTTEGVEVPVNRQTGEPIMPPSGASEPSPAPPQIPVARSTMTPELVQAAHARIDKAAIDKKIAVGDVDTYHAQLDQMLAHGAAPDELARFLYGRVEGQTVKPTSLLRTIRTGSMAGGLTTEGKVLLSPIIQTAMRAPVGVVQALIERNPGNIRSGLQGGIAGLAEGSVDALQTLRYGINDRAALAGTASGGYGFAPGLEVMGSNVLKRVAGTAAMGLVRTHGAISDISAGIGRGAARAQGKTAEQAGEIGQQWALRSGNYGTIGKMVSRQLEGLRSVNPAMDVVGQVLVPFYRVGYNALTQGVELSPVGALGTAADVGRARLPASTPSWLRGPYAAGVENSAVTPVATRLTRNLFGVGLAAYGLAQASAGNITGDHPPTGDPKWSIRVPETAKLGPLEGLARRDRNGNLWLPIRALGPAGEALAQSAILYEAIRNGGNDIPDVAARAAAAYVGHVEDESFLSGIVNVVSLLDDAKNLYSQSAFVARQAQRDLAYEATSLGKSFIPQDRLAEQIGSALGVYAPPGSNAPNYSVTTEKTPAVAPTRTPAPTPARRYVPPARATATPRTRP